MKKRTIIFGAISLICVMCIGASAFMLSGFAQDASEAQDKELLEAVTAAEEAILSVGVVPAEYLLEEVDLAAVEAGEAELVPQEVKEKLMEAQDSSLADAYTKDIADPLHETIGTVLEASNDLIDFDIDSGVLSPTLISTQKGENGQMIVMIECVGWLKAVQQIETDDLYHAQLIMAKDLITYSLIEQDGQWVVNGTLDMTMEIAPDTYSPFKGAYETLEEAVRAATMLNPEEENPF